jgi:hypothetical protein
MKSKPLPLHNAQAFALRKIGERGGAFEPFLLGWQHGWMTGLYASLAETENFVAGEKAAGRFPADLRSDWVEIYLNGRDDGVKRDTTRVAMIRRNGDQEELKLTIEKA